MLHSFRSLCLAGVALLALVSSLSAQEGRPQRGPGGPGGFRNPTELPRGLEATDEQKAKLADIQKKFADKVKAAQDKAKLTEEQQGKMRDVFTKAREANTPRQEMQAFMAKELGLTDDQKKGREELTALTAEITKEVEGVLTDEQKTKLKESRSQRGGERGKRPERKKSE
ncbi:LTXXQ motif protein [Anatilimnocola aggregata]|uniref:LTXXQ motif protein n=1 Tax=Anatilimnocola aggregata TaxID=2528021 RepID=A0A517Y9V0_9BACT|nr:hypothetical protein [Anatilimnocola aggregata]QDU27006.1 LTXXQ motif protein [Anatilimnocola aggregata]